MVIVDVMALALGFVLRAVAGALIVAVEISPWLLICTVLLALFLGLSKRRHELILLEADAFDHRKILKEYSPALLDEMISVVTSSTVIAYTLYTFFSKTATKTHYLMLTVPLEGVIKTLLEDGYQKDKIYAAHNKTVVVSAKKGELANKHKPVVDKYGLRNIHLYEGEEWIRYEPKGKMLVLDAIFPEGIQIPKRLISSNIIHLPTLKTHVFTQMTGAMKNAFGGLLHENRRWTHSVIHETLVDLLTIQKEIHPGIFGVMDGTFVGDGPGPRCMVPYVKN